MKVILNAHRRGFQSSYCRSAPFLYSVISTCSNVLKYQGGACVSDLCTFWKNSYQMKPFTLLWPQASLQGQENESHFALLLHMIQRRFQFCHIYFLKRTSTHHTMFELQCHAAFVCSILLKPLFHFASFKIYTAEKNKGNKRPTVITHPGSE